MKEGIHPSTAKSASSTCPTASSSSPARAPRRARRSRWTTAASCRCIKLETTSESHPFYTGTQKSVDSLGGRVEKFRNKFAHLGTKK